MTAKELKEIINEIPDNKELIFEYSCFTFENVSEIITREKEMASCIDCDLQEFRAYYPRRNYVMISFTN